MATGWSILAMTGEGCAPVPAHWLASLPIAGSEPLNDPLLTLLAIITIPVGMD